MSQVEQTGEEVMDSLTGFDEMAVAQHFGKTVAHLAEHDELMLGRALVFVTKRRGESKLNDDDARNFAMNMRLGDLNSYFADPAAESEEAGKDEPDSEQQPAISLTSVS